MNEQFHPNPAEIIYSERWNTFRQHTERTGSIRTLEIPDSLTNIFIPQRILELSDNPENVYTLPIKNVSETISESAINLYIIEKKKTPVSDPAIFNDFKNMRIDPEWKKERKSFYLDTTAPNGLDFRHASNERLITSGLIDEFDKILIEYHADIPRGYPDIIQTIQYIDRPDMHNQGIGKSFFDNVEKIWRELGFSYHTAVIWSPNPSFFSKRGTEIHEVDPEIKDRIFPLYQGYIEQGSPVIITEL